MVLELLFTPDKSKIGKINSQIDANKKTITAALETLDQLLYLPEGKAMLAAIKEKRARYVASFSSVGKLLNED